MHIRDVKIGGKYIVCLPSIDEIVEVVYASSSTGTVIVKPLDRIWERLWLHAIDLSEYKE